MELRSLPTKENYLGLPPEWSDVAQSQVVLIPIPYERSSSYLWGSARGPAEIIAASRSLELYDEELGLEVFRAAGGIATLSPSTLEMDVAPAALADSSAALVRALLEDGKFVVTLGGEHTSVLGAVRAHAEKFENVTVLQLDAHADLRQQYEGDPYSHACVMARVTDLHHDVMQIGLRSLCKEEAEAVSGRQDRIVPARLMRESEGAWAEPVLAQLAENVYLTIDCDYFDPSIMPAVGTPEPGGMLWDETLKFLRTLSRARRVVGFDVSELRPIPDVVAPNVLAAKLIHKLLGYLFSPADAPR